MPAKYEHVNGTLSKRQNTASITFDENNAGGRLENAFILVCHRDRCAQGEVTRSDAGTGYTISLKSTADSAAPNVDVAVEPGPGTPTLRFSLRWSLEYSGQGGPVDGDTYRVEARVSQSGQSLFDRTFTAAYQTQTVCGMMCKVFDVRP